MVFFIFDFLVIGLHFLFGKNLFFHLDIEYNLPNFYKSIKYLLIIIFAFIIFLKNKKINWFLFFLISLYLGLDDGLALHEKYGSIIFYKLFSSSSLASFYSNRLAGFSWYPILFLPAILIFVFLFYFWQRSLLSLDSKLANFFLLGIICLLIAFILEPIGSFLWLYQKVYQIEVVFEEGLEIIALTFILSALYLISKNKVYGTRNEKTGTF